MFNVNDRSGAGYQKKQGRVLDRDGEDAFRPRKSPCAFDFNRLGPDVRVAICKAGQVIF